MKNQKLQTVIKLQSHERLAPILAGLTEPTIPTLIDISGLKDISLEDFRALQRWELCSRSRRFSIELSARSFTEEVA